MTFARQLESKLDVVPAWFRNTAIVLAAGGWMCLGGLWVVAPEWLMVCLGAAALSTLVAAACGVLLSRPGLPVVGSGLLAVVGIGLTVVEFALDWAFVWPLYLLVIGYGQVTALWLATVLVLANWPRLPRSVGLAGMTLACAGVFLLELCFLGTGGLRVGLAVLAGLLVFLGIGVAVTSADGRQRRREFRVLPWWSVPLGLVLVAVSIWASTAWLLREAGQNPALRIDAIKTGLTVGAGAGGVTALLLAVRRQWLNERAQVHTEADAVDRRVTELFSTAAEHLGHASGAVRLAGLKTLERLGKDHEEHRQNVVDMACAYLRMPFTHPDELLPEEYAYIDDLEIDPATTERIEQANQELQVRLAAQDLLSRVGSDSALQLFLRRATLVDFRLWDCRMSFLDCHLARFVGPANFDGLTIEACDFEQTQFRGQLAFARTEFVGRGSFRHASFAKEPRLEDVRGAADQVTWPAGWRAEPGPDGGTRLVKDDA